MSPLELALCITDLAPGGAERCLTELAAGVDRARFHPIVYCLASPPAAPQDTCLRRLREAGVETHFLHARRAWHAPRTLLRLRSLLARQRPAIVQTFLFHANLLGRVAARLAGCRTVVSGIRVAERRGRWHLHLDRWTQRLVARHVCVSASVADFSHAIARLSRPKLRVIPNGIDLSRYHGVTAVDHVELGIPPGRRIATYVGRLDPQKGLDWLLEAAPQWLPLTPDCDLVLVGAGPQESALRRQVAAQGISDRVHFLGWRDDVPAILAASSLLLLPSRWEGMPNVVLEAMASGLPVVATEAEGVRELLGPAAGPQIVPFGDTHALQASCLLLLRDRPCAATWGAANRQRAKDHFSLQDMLEAYQTLWLSEAAPEVPLRR